MGAEPSVVHLEDVLGLLERVGSSAWISLGIGILSSLYDVNEGAIRSKESDVEIDVAIRHPKITWIGLGVDKDHSVVSRNISPIHESVLLLSAGDGDLGMDFLSVDS
jgi:hypothetical protein